MWCYWILQQQLWSTITQLNTLYIIYMSIQSNYYILVVAWYHWSNMTVLHYNDNHQPPPSRSASSVYLQGLGINWFSQPMYGVWVCFKCQNPADVEAFVNCLYLLTLQWYMYIIYTNTNNFVGYSYHIIHIYYIYRCKPRKSSAGFPNPQNHMWL